MPRPARQRSLRRKLLLSMLPLAVLLLVAELTIRLVRAPLHFGSFRTIRVDMMQRGYPATLDDQLGYVPRAGFASNDNHWGTQVTIDEGGLRKHTGKAPAGGRPIVAVGDSFTFGDQVDDDATWPAQLEAILQRRVLNGGVFGYSFAQAVLRGEQLVLRHRADCLVLSFIAGDLERCEFSKRYAPVPWFELVGNALVLRNVPVQDTADHDELRRRSLKDLLGYSALIDATMAHAFPAWWMNDQKEVRVMPSGAGGHIGLLLTSRIATFCREHECRLLLVLQGTAPNPHADAVVQHARKLGVPTLDLVERLLIAAKQDPQVHDRWFAGHMTPAGNRWAAEQIAAAIRAGN